MSAFILLSWISRVTQRLLRTLIEHAILVRFHQQFFLQFVRGTFICGHDFDTISQHSRSSTYFAIDLYLPRLANNRLQSFYMPLSQSEPVCLALASVRKIGYRSICEDKLVSKTSWLANELRSRTRRMKTATYSQTLDWLAYRNVTIEADILSRLSIRIFSTHWWLSQSSARQDCQFKRYISLLWSCPASSVSSMSSTKRWMIPCQRIWKWALDWSLGQPLISHRHLSWPHPDLDSLQLYHVSKIFLQGVDCIKPFDMCSIGEFCGWLAWYHTPINTSALQVLTQPQYNKVPASPSDLHMTSTPNRYFNIAKTPNKLEAWYQHEFPRIHPQWHTNDRELFTQAFQLHYQSLNGSRSSQSGANELFRNHHWRPPRTSLFDRYISTDLHSWLPHFEKGAHHGCSRSSKTIPSWHLSLLHFDINDLPARTDFWSHLYPVAWRWTHDYPLDCHGHRARVRSLSRHEHSPSPGCLCSCCRCDRRLGSTEWTATYAVLPTFLEAHVGVVSDSCFPFSSWWWVSHMSRKYQGNTHSHLSSRQMSSSLLQRLHTEYQQNGMNDRRCPSCRRSVIDLSKWDYFHWDSSAISTIELNMLRWWEFLSKQWDMLGATIFSLIRFFVCLSAWQPWSSVFETREASPLSESQSHSECYHNICLECLRMSSDVKFRPTPEVYNTDSCEIIIFI